MSLWWSIINRPTAGETRRAVLAQMRRANDLKECEVRALEQLAKQQERSEPRLATMRCDQCDNGIELPWNFCAWCGHQLKDDE